MLKLAAFVMLGGAGFACRLRARAERDGELLSVARVLELLLAIDLARALLGVAILTPARLAGRVPFEGWERAAFHATQLGVLAWPFACAGLAWQLFTRLRPALWIFVPWAWVAFVICRDYPELRGDALGDVYRVVIAGSAGLGLLALTGARPDRFRLGRAHLCSLLLLAGLAAELAGPFLDAPFASWPLAQATWIPVLGAVALCAAWRIPWESRACSSRSSPSQS